MQLPRIGMLELKLDSERMKPILLGLAAANVLFFLGTLLSFAWRGLDWRVGFIFTQFNLARENNLAAWYSAMLLLCVALVLLLCFVVDRREVERAGGEKRGWLVYGWLLMAALFAAFSLDELGSLHERVSRLESVRAVLPQLRGQDGWQTVLGVPIIVVGVGVLAFIWFRVRLVKPAFRLMLLGLLLLATVPFYENLEKAMEVASGLGGEFVTPTYLLAVEEGSEVFGMLLFLMAGLAFVRLRGGERVAVTVGPREVAILAALTAVGMAIAHLLFPHVFDVHDGRGIPQNWFPSALATIVALSCFGIAATWRGEGRGTPRALVVMGVVHLLLAIDHGSAHAYTEWFFSNRPAVALLRDAAGIMVLAIAAAYAIWEIRSGRTRMALTVWLALQVIVYMVAPVLRPFFAPAAYLLLLAGILPLLPSPPVNVATAASPPGTPAHR